MKTKLLVGAILAVAIVCFLNDRVKKWRISHRQPHQEYAVSGYTNNRELTHTECRIWTAEDGEFYYAVAVSNVDFEPNMPEFSYRRTWSMDEGAALTVNGTPIKYSPTKRIFALNPFGDMQEIELNEDEAQVAASDHKQIWESVVLPRLYRFTGESEGGKRVGPWTCSDAQGRKAYEGEYADGKRDGEWIYYYPSGAIRAVIHYKNGKRNGEWTYFTEDGAQISSISWRDDEPIDRAARQVGLDYWDIIYPNKTSQGGSGSTLPDRGHGSHRQPDTFSVGN
jgi:hypothetical protein